MITSNNSKRTNYVSLLHKIKEYKMLYVFLIPAMLYFIIFYYIPMYGAIIAFKDFQVSKGILGSPWIGFANFKQLFGGATFPQVLRNSILINTYKIIFGFPAPILLAILLCELKNLKFKKIVQTISYFPYFLSWVVLFGIFMDFLSPSIGPINILFKSLGMKPIFFLGSTEWFRSVLVSTNVWKNVGYGSIIYMAAIIGINQELFEAAIVDGATRLKRIIHITIPSIAPMITIMFVLNIGNIIRDDFDQVWNFLNPAVADVGDVIATYVYRSGIVDMNMSYATAAGLFQSVIALILVLSANYITKRFNEYGLW